MKVAKKVAIALNLQEPMPEVFKSLKDYDFLKDTDVHVIYSFMTTTYAFGLGETALIFPMENDRKKIEESVVAMLKDISGSLFPKGFTSRLSAHCLFSDNTKAKFCEFVEKEHIDTVVVAAREKKGLFDSSFTHYLTKHTRANVLILKHLV